MVTSRRSRKHLVTSVALIGCLVVAYLGLNGPVLPGRRGSEAISGNGRNLDDSSVVYKINTNQNLISSINVTDVRHRNKQRLARIQFYCGSQPELHTIPESIRVYTITSLNLSITLIAKVASTTWALFMSQIQVRECLKQVDPPRYVSLHTCVREKLMSGRKLSVNAVLVRNPWKRLVSVYNEKVIRSDYKRPQIVQCQQKHMLSGNQTLTFSQFAACILATPVPDTLDPHWRPQYLMHGPCTSGFTHIVKLETMDSDLLNIIQVGNPNFKPSDITRLMDQFTTEQRRPWETAPKNKSLAHMYRELTSEQVSSLQYLYRWDCHLYQYAFNPLKDGGYIDE